MWVPLPLHYGDDRIVLQTRDPWWLHTYWELKSATVSRGRAQLGAEAEAAFFALRVYQEGASWFDIPVHSEVGDWYIEVKPDAAWTVEIGLKTPGGRFLALARSNTVRTPPDRPSDRIDEKWGVLKGLPTDRFESSSSARPAR